MEPARSRLFMRRRGHDCSLAASLYVPGCQRTKNYRPAARSENKRFVLFMQTARWV